MTLVTQLTVNRIPQLTAQCGTWRGPLAAAVYLSFVAPEHDGEDGGALTPDAKKKLEEAVSRIEEVVSRWVSIWWQGRGRTLANSDRCFRTIASGL